MTATARVPGVAGAAPFDAERVRSDFPGLALRIRGYPLIYLDNAATSQRPRQVIDAISTFELTHAANVHRGVHTLSQEATAAYDEAREKVRAFINAGHASEIIFTSGTTASLNLVAGSFGRRFLKPGDEILLTEMEHHSNLVPWQLIAEQTGAVVRALPVDDHGELEREALGRLIGPRTRIVALAHVSNVLGTVNPVREIAELAHARGAVVVVDGAQAVPHLPVDVQQLGCDFYAASAHKMYGPTGVGFLYGRLELLEKMPPWQSGGGTIEQGDGRVRYLGRAIRGGNSADRSGDRIGCGDRLLPDSRGREPRAARAGAAFLCDCSGGTAPGHPAHRNGQGHSERSLLLG